VGVVQLQRPSGFPQVNSAAAEGPVKVSLHDCLACSGCVTSAETILLQHQSIEEFTAKLSDPRTTVVVSLSPQSIVSLAAVYDLHPAECVAKITAVLKSHGVAAVFDINWARDVSLLESAAEFIDRYIHNRNGGSTDDNSNGGAVDMAIDNSSSSKINDGDAPSSFTSQSPLPLPMLASACPGWVCYAEKTHGNFVLPYISTAKSPQAVMGTLIKQQWGMSKGIDPAHVYHCAVMPCYDKKLEASRDDFTVPLSSLSQSNTRDFSTDNFRTAPSRNSAPIPETDCVLATTELYEWLQSLHISENWAAIPSAPFDAPFSNQVVTSSSSSPTTINNQYVGTSYSVPGGSGGYMEYIFRTAARELFNQELPPGQPLPIIQGRNADIKECSLVVNGQRVLHFAAAYGFRNIQGLMRKIKSNRCEYDYVEVMACPSGCLNGGGQMKPETTAAAVTGTKGKKVSSSQSVQQLIEQLEIAYHNTEYLEDRLPQLNSSVEELYREWIQGVPGSAESKEILHTKYHLREKTVASAIADW
jgi:iron only hydrogenase large subunit-like protein